MTQAMFGTPLRVTSSRNNYCRITLPEGYRGWILNTHFEQVTESLFHKFTNARNRFFIKPGLFELKIQKRQVMPYQLFFGTELIVSQRKNQTAFLLPNGNWMPIAKINLKKNDGKPDKAGAIIRTAGRFLGVPYLWGGITPFGYDCSGLVQMVYRYHGIELPRDSSAQMKVGKKIARDNILIGDLLYFKGHVAVSLGGDEILHASNTRGMTLIESLSESSTNYREDLDKGFLFGRRVI